MEEAIQKLCYQEVEYILFGANTPGVSRTALAGQLDSLLGSFHGCQQETVSGWNQHQRPTSTSTREANSLPLAG